MFPELSILKKPTLLKELFSIRRKIYKKICSLNVEVATGDEPFPLEKAEFRPINGGSWGKAFTVAIFHITGQIPDSLSKDNLAIIADLGGEGQLYFEGTPTIGLTNRVITPLDFFQAHKGKTLIEIDDAHCNGAKIDFFVDASYNGASFLINPYGKSKFKEVCLVEINKEIKSLYYDFLTLIYLSENKEIKSALRIAYSQFFKEDYSKAKDTLAPYLSATEKKDFTFYAVGHSHLDLAWEWPIREGKRKSIRTFSNQLRHIERYPNFVYGASQPQQFEWAQTKLPKFFDKLSDAVKNNRLELQGAMWVETDTNLPSGESLIRQIYYGQNYWKDNFGKTSKMCWLPDVFGYSGNLPQILAKSGVPYLMTIKLSWNTVNDFPYSTFNWHGIDDSEVLVHLPPSGNYCGSGTPDCFKDAYKKFKEKDILDKALFLFGAGDGGGGPSEAQLEVISRQVDAQNSCVKFSPAESFFEDIKNSIPKLPSYKGELYLEKHQGTYTTQGKTKLLNRKIENLLHSTEFISTMRMIKGIEYPDEMLDRIWKLVLLYQFHDILPGSSIGRVYKECEESYLSMIDELNKNIAISADNKIWLNTSPFSIDQNFIVDDKCYHYSSKSYSTATPIEVQKANDNLKYTEDSIENGKIKVVFDNTGAIISLIDKESSFEFAQNKLNDVTIYRDPYSYYSAWDIRTRYTKSPKRHFIVSNVDTKVVGNAIVRNQTLRCGKSSVMQKITIDVDSSLIIIENTATLNRTFRMLRADFRPSVWADEVTCDIQMGNIKRSTKENNSINKAQFEICAHKYIDVNNGNYGFAILNNGKYGYRTKNNNISVNLIRNPIFPDSKADRGENNFTYAILPYCGSFENSEVIRNSYILNQPPIPVAEQIESPFTVIGDVVAETIKKSKENNTIVLRIYEAKGQKTKAEIVPNFKYAEVLQTDLLENNGLETLLKVEFSPFEIKTFLFKL
ncbi:MAG: glycoside hydrolase family 38 C-terminal domain-containing protein [Clostridia bacterium]|nr:glycoside hydrolase family 38 C-terminal domain-containing protein [Clostridia bacterium]